MKTLPPADENARFSGQLRHYHRTTAKPQKSWDEWIDGRPADPAALGNWMKIAGIIVGILALAAIAIGLFIELR